eukprot:jgi/Mesvir1/7684/Mv11654-RA.1
MSFAEKENCTPEGGLYNGHSSLQSLKARLGGLKVRDPNRVPEEPRSAEKPAFAKPSPKADNNRGHGTPAPASQAKRSLWEHDLDAYLASNSRSPLNEHSERARLVTALRSSPESPDTWLRFLEYEEKAEADKTVVNRSRSHAHDGNSISLLRLFEWATKTIPLAGNKKDSSYLRVWLGYIRQQCVVSENDARDTFKFLATRRIGEELAALYATWAQLEQRTGHLDKAIAVVRKGIECGAQPASELSDLYTRLQDAVAQGKAALISWGTAAAAAAGTALASSGVVEGAVRLLPDHGAAQRSDRATHPHHQPGAFAESMQVGQVAGNHGAGPHMHTPLVARTPLASVVPNQGGQWAGHVPSTPCTPASLSLAGPPRPPAPPPFRPASSVVSGASFSFQPQPQGPGHEADAVSTKAGMMGEGAEAGGQHGAGDAGGQASQPPPTQPQTPAFGGAPAGGSHIVGVARWGAAPSGCGDSFMTPVGPRVADRWTLADAEYSQGEGRNPPSAASVARPDHAHVGAAALHAGLSQGLPLIPGTPGTVLPSAATDVTPALFVRAGGEAGGDKALPSLELPSGASNPFPADNGSSALTRSGVVVDHPAPVQQLQAAGVVALPSCAGTAKDLRGSGAGAGDAAVGGDLLGASRDRRPSTGSSNHNSTGSSNGTQTQDDGATMPLSQPSAALGGAPGVVYQRQRGAIRPAMGPPVRHATVPSETAASFTNAKTTAFAEAPVAAPTRVSVGPEPSFSFQVTPSTASGCPSESYGAGFGPQPASHPTHLDKGAAADTHRSQPAPAASSQFSSGDSHRGPHGNSRMETAHGGGGDAMACEGAEGSSQHRASPEDATAALDEEQRARSLLSLDDENATISVRPSVALVSLRQGGTGVGGGLGRGVGARLPLGSCTSTAARGQIQPRNMPRALGLSKGPACRVVVPALRVPARASVDGDDDEEGGVIHEDAAGEAADDDATVAMSSVSSQPPEGHHGDHTGPAGADASRKGSHQDDPLEDAEATLPMPKLAATRLATDTPQSHQGPPRVALTPLDVTVCVENLPTDEQLLEKMMAMEDVPISAGTESGAGRKRKADEENLHPSRPIGHVQGSNRAQGQDGDSAPHHHHHHHHRASDGDLRSASLDAAWWQQQKQGQGVDSSGPAAGAVVTGGRPQLPRTQSMQLDRAGGAQPAGRAEGARPPLAILNAGPLPSAAVASQVTSEAASRDQREALGAGAVAPSSMHAVDELSPGQGISLRRHAHKNGMEESSSDEPTKPLAPATEPGHLAMGAAPASWARSQQPVAPASLVGQSTVGTAGVPSQSDARKAVPAGLGVQPSAVSSAPASTMAASAASYSQPQPPNGPAPMARDRPSAQVTFAAPHEAIGRVNAVPGPAPPPVAAPPVSVPAAVPMGRADAPGGGWYEDENVVVVNGTPYTKLDCVGRGGSSKVFKVIAPSKKIYALKRIALTGREVDTSAGFLEEVTLLQRLHGIECIIQLIDSQVIVHRPASAGRGMEGLIYMVLEYGEIDLARMLTKRQQATSQAGDGGVRIPLVDANFLRLYWQQMLEAVHTIHKERIVHSDLKPANFLFVEGALKLIDFGIAKTILNDTTSIVRESQVGTLNYMSPEAILSGSDAGEGGARIKVGRASDIWSLGCILYQMVYGRTPFSHLSFIQKLHAITDPHHEIEFPPFSSGPHEELLHTLRSCLERNPARRITIPQLLSHRFLHPSAPMPPPTPTLNTAAPVQGPVALATGALPLQSLPPSGAAPLLPASGTNEALQQQLQQILVAVSQLPGVDPSHLAQSIMQHLQAAGGNAGNENSINGNSASLMDASAAGAGMGSGSGRPPVAAPPPPPPPPRCPPPPPVMPLRVTHQGAMAPPGTNPPQSSQANCLAPSHMAPGPRAGGAPLGSGAPPRGGLAGFLDGAELQKALLMQQAQLRPVPPRAQEERRSAAEGAGNDLESILRKGLERFQFPQGDTTMEPSNTSTLQWEMS